MVEAVALYEKTDLLFDSVPLMNCQEVSLVLGYYYFDVQQDLPCWALLPSLCRLSLGALPLAWVLPLCTTVTRLLGISRFRYRRRLIFGRVPWRCPKCSGCLELGLRRRHTASTGS